MYGIRFVDMFAVELNDPYSSKIIGDFRIQVRQAHFAGASQDFNSLVNLKLPNGMFTHNHGIACLFCKEVSIGQQIGDISYMKFVALCLFNLFFSSFKFGVLSSLTWVFCRTWVFRLPNSDTIVRASASCLSAHMHACHTFEAICTVDVLASKVHTSTTTLQRESATLQGIRTLKVGGINIMIIEIDFMKSS